MPEMTLRIVWPDGEVEDCYSPSTVIRDYFEPGRSYPLAEFHGRAVEALHAANARVRARFGMGCSQALAQIAEFDRRAAAYGDRRDAQVRVESFHP